MKAETDRFGQGEGGFLLRSLFANNGTNIPPTESQTTEFMHVPANQIIQTGTHNGLNLDIVFCVCFSPGWEGK